ncbi:MAG: phosphoribosylglycinamide formyltransferase, partial [Pseudomonadales bacterium]
LPAEISLVVSNNSQSGALKRAHTHGIDTVHLSLKTHPGEDVLDGAIEAALVESGAHWVLLTGYMKKLGPKTLNRYRNHILNTHPALLPRYGGQGFFGRKVHAAVLRAGDSETGATVHLVDADYDTGPILAQARVPVRANDNEESLEERVKEAERKLIVTTLCELAARKEASSH